MKKELATVHVQAKLTLTEYEPFEKIIGITGLKKATLFRKVILSNKNNVVCLTQSAEEEESKNECYSSPIKHQTTLTS
uniref:Uncharacterized protein n=1 Tax=Vibrio sp. FF_273 TaxID=1652830 RepID=A0A0H4A3M7_9VIBR|nr:hypothetical protein [Vibrio sp. FF_273]